MLYKLLDFLPLEVINIIYSYDDIFYIKYNKTIEIINKFPHYMYSNSKQEHYFTKYFYNIGVQTSMCVNKVPNYKKALLIVIKYFVNKF